MELTTGFNPSWITAIAASAAAITWVLKTLKGMRNGNGNSNGDLVKEMAKNVTALSYATESNGKLLEELVGLHRESHQVLIEIERRSKGSEEAIRRVGDIWENKPRRR